MPLINLIPYKIQANQEPITLFQELISVKIKLGKPNPDKYRDSLQVLGFWIKYDLDYLVIYMNLVIENLEDTELVQIPGYTIATPLLRTLSTMLILIRDSLVNEEHVYNAITLEFCKRNISDPANSSSFIDFLRLYGIISFSTNFTNYFDFLKLLYNARDLSSEPETYERIIRAIDVTNTSPGVVAKTVEDVLQGNPEIYEINNETGEITFIFSSSSPEVNQAQDIFTAFTFSKLALVTIIVTDNDFYITDHTLDDAVLTDTDKEAIIEKCKTIIISKEKQPDNTAASINQTGSQNPKVGPRVVKSSGPNKRWLRQAYVPQKPSGKQQKPTQRHKKPILKTDLITTELDSAQISPEMMSRLQDLANQISSPHIDIPGHIIKKIGKDFYEIRPIATGSHSMYRVFFKRVYINGEARNEVFGVTFTHRDAENFIKNN